VGSSGARVISLFSGAGGLDLGVEDAGGRIRVCVEADPVCVATLEMNRKYFPFAKVIGRPIETVTTGELLKEAGMVKGEAALQVGGPPCQPFSKAAYWLQSRRMGVKDARAGLLAQYLRVLRGAKPEGFIFENVASLQHPTNRVALDQIVDGARRAGYSVAVRLLHAVEYGVPQTRSRVFVIGLRGRAQPTFPEPTHCWLPHANGNGHARKLKPAEVAGRWIGHLDRERLFEPEEIIKGRWERHLRAIPPGSNYKALTAWAGCKDPVFLPETRYWSFLLKLSPARPSWTLPASPGPWVGPFHWTTRRLRVPELAALQTFPSGYRFAGTRRQIVRQIGNAVPCLLASRVAAELLRQILGREPARGKKLRYQYCDDFPFDEFVTNHKGARW
jgi:DNA (cytosine-5)-methyltransferase 1